MTLSTKKQGRSASSQVGIMAVVGFLAFSELVSGLLQSWYPPLLSMLGQRLGAETAQLNWVNATYLLSSVVFVPLLAKLGDLLGHKRMVILSLISVVIGTVVTSFATDFSVFLLGRVLQGTLGAILPLEMAIVREKAGDRASKGIGVLVACLSAGAALGTISAGALGVFLDLTWILLIPGVLVLVSLLLIQFTVPETTIRGEGSIDWKGATFLGAGLGLVLYAVGNGNAMGWFSPMIVAMIVTGFAAIVLFIRTEKRVTHPLIDIPLVTRGGMGFYLLLMLLFGAQFYGSGVVNSLFVASKPEVAGYGFGLNSLGVSLTLMPTTAMMTVGALTGASLVSRFGQLPVLIGANILVIAKFAMVMLYFDDLPLFVAAQFVGGLGIGLFVALMPAIIVGMAPKNASGIAGAMYGTSRTLSGAIGGAIFAAVMSALFVPGTKIPELAAFLTVWAICGGLSVVIVLILPLSGRIERSHLQHSRLVPPDADLKLASRERTP